MKRSVPIDAHSIGSARAAPREAGAVVALRETLLLNLLVPFRGAFRSSSSTQLAAGAGARYARAVFLDQQRGAYRRSQSSKSKAVSMSGSHSADHEHRCTRSRTQPTGP